MKNLLLIICFSTLVSCKAQEKFKLLYLNKSYSETKNKSFLNKQLRFLNNKDTLYINIKIPYYTKKKEVIDRGIFYNCYLQEGVVYTIELQKVCVIDIPEPFNSYYKTNATFDKADCSKFVEIEKHTDYEYKGNYGMYVDIGNVLYKIVGLSPNDTCVFQH